MRLGRINRTSSYLIVTCSLCCLLLVFIPNFDVLPAKRNILDTLGGKVVQPVNRIEDYAKSDRLTYKDVWNFKDTSQIMTGKSGYPLKAPQRESMNAKFEGPIIKLVDSVKAKLDGSNAKQVISPRAKARSSLNSGARDSLNGNFKNSSSVETNTSSTVKEASAEEHLRNDKTESSLLESHAVKVQKESSIQKTIREDLHTRTQTTENYENFAFRRGLRLVHNELVKQESKTSD